MKNNPKNTLNEEIQRIKSLFYENFNKNDFTLQGNIMSKEGLIVNLFGEEKIGNVSLINFDDAFDLDYDVERFYNDKEKYCKNRCDKYFFNGDNSVYLYSLLINPSYRGKGHGKNLVQKCHQIVRDMGYKYVLLITDRNNDIAQSLYNKLGYKIHQSDERKDFYFVEV